MERERVEGGEAASISSAASLELAKHVEVPLEWLARTPASARETQLLLSTASVARELELSFEVYVKLAERKHKLDSAWQSAVSRGSLELNASIPFLSNLVCQSRSARLKLMTRFSELFDRLLQYAEELSKFSHVNKMTSEGLKRQAKAAPSSVIRKALEREYLGRHVLAECERAIAKRIERFAGSPGGRHQNLDYASLSEFIKELEIRSELLVPSVDNSMEVERAEEFESDIPDSCDKETETPTLTIREGIKAKKRQRVSETPTQKLDNMNRVSHSLSLPGFDVASGSSFGLGTAEDHRQMNKALERDSGQRHSPRLTNAVVDLALDPTLQCTNGSASDDSRKATPSLTPNQTAQVVVTAAAMPRSQQSPLPTIRSGLGAGGSGSGSGSGSGGKKTVLDEPKQGRSPWATPGIGRERTRSGICPRTRGEGREGGSKDLPSAENSGGAPSGNASSGRQRQRELQRGRETEMAAETETENKFFDNIDPNEDQVGCALNFDDLQVGKSQSQSQQQSNKSNKSHNKKKRPRKVTPSLSSDENSQKVAENLKLSVTPSPSPPLAASS